jgi:hypothetical protein
LAYGCITGEYHGRKEKESSHWANISAGSSIGLRHTPFRLFPVTTRSAFKYEEESKRRRE